MVADRETKHIVSGSLGGKVDVISERASYPITSVQIWIHSSLLHLHLTLGIPGELLFKVGILELLYW